MWFVIEQKFYMSNENAFTVLSMKTNYCNVVYFASFYRRICQAVMLYIIYFIFSLFYFIRLVHWLATVIGFY